MISGGIENLDLPVRNPDIPGKPKRPVGCRILPKTKMLRNRFEHSVYFNRYNILRRFVNRYRQHLDRNQLESFPTTPRFLYWQLPRRPLAQTG